MNTKNIPGILLLIIILSSAALSYAAPDRRIAAPAAKQAGERRLALIIGNGAYKDSPLANPVNDADSMAEALQLAGFEVMLRKNLGRKEMRGAIREFGDKLAASGGMGLFYYAGHGMAVKGNNYLIPVGADIQRATEIEDEAISAASILAVMEEAKNSLNLLVLDACRNNPFASRFRSGDKGLATMNPPTGVLVLYATSPGSVANDGSGSNGVFTKHFIDKMNLDGLDIRIMIGKVTEAVRQETANSQSPYMEGMITGEFAFRFAQTGVAEPSAVVTADPGLRELRLWEGAQKANSPAAYRAYLKKYPHGEYAEMANEMIAALEAPPAQAVARPAAAPPGSALVPARNGRPQGSSLQPFTDVFTGMEFVPVKGGCFMMGDSFGDGHNDEKPMHEACVGDFAMGKYEVTQAQWQKMMGNNPSYFSSCGDNCPVETVSWDAVQQFIRKLNSQSGKQYRLPTEAEWEYGARSGGKHEKWAGTSADKKVGEYAWYYKNSKDKSHSFGKTHPVGKKKPNGLGLFDMSGNVWEMVSDWGGEYNSGRQQDPTGPATGSSRVIRGGSWFYETWYVRASSRGYKDPGFHDSTLGFRLIAPVQ